MLTLHRLVWKIRRRLRPLTVQVRENVNLENRTGVSSQMLKELIESIREYDFEASVPSCIVASAAIQDVLRALGVEATVLPVKMVIANDVYRRLSAEGSLPKERRAQLGLGAAALRSDGPDSETGWAGHLITIVDRHWIVDPTLDGLFGRLNPLVSDNAIELLSGGELHFKFGRVNVAYTMDVENVRFEKTPAWALESRKNSFSYLLGSLGRRRDTEAFRILKALASAKAAAKAKDVS